MASPFDIRPPAAGGPSVSPQPQARGVGGFGSVIEKIFGPSTVGLGYRQEQEKGFANARVMERLGQLQAEGGTPQQVLTKMLADPVFLEAFGSDPNIGKTVSDMVGSLTPQTEVLAPGAAIVQQQPGGDFTQLFRNPAASEAGGLTTEVQTFNQMTEIAKFSPEERMALARTMLLSKQAGNPTQAEAALNALQQKGLISEETKLKLLGGVIQIVPERDEYGEITGESKIIDLSDPNGPTVFDPNRLNASPGPLGGRTEVSPGPGGGSSGTPLNNAPIASARPPVPVSTRAFHGPAPGQTPAIGDGEAPARQGGVPGGIGTVRGEGGRAPGTGTFSTTIAQAPPVWQQTFTQVAAENRLPPDLLPSIAWRESRFNPSAVGPKTRFGSAKGLMQFIDSTARAYGVNQMDAGSSIRGAGKFMAELMAKYGSVPVALAAYNWGPGNVDRWLARGGDFNRLPSETRGYIAEITGQPIPGERAAAGGTVSAAPAGSVQDAEGDVRDVGMAPVEDLLEDPSEAFAGLGFFGGITEKVGNIARNINPALTVGKRQAAQRNHIRRIRAGLSSLRATGRVLKDEFEEMMKLAPSLGPVEDPIAGVQDGIQLLDWLIRLKAQAQSVDEDRTREKQVRKKAAEDVREYDKVIAILPTREQMANRIKLLEEGRGGQVLPSDAIEAAKKLLGQTEEAIGEQLGTKKAPAPAAKQPSARLPAIEKMTLQELEAFAKDPQATLEELQAAEKRWRQLKRGG